MDRTNFFIARHKSDLTSPPRHVNFNLVFVKLHECSPYSPQEVLLRTLAIWKFCILHICKRMYFGTFFGKQRLADPFCRPDGSMRAPLRRVKKEGVHNRCRPSHCLWKVLHLGREDVKDNKNSQRRWKTSHFIHGLNLIAIGENAINNIEIPSNKPTVLIGINCGIQHLIKHIYWATSSFLSQYYPYDLNPPLNMYLYCLLSMRSWASHTPEMSHKLKVNPIIIGSYTVYV